MSELVVAVKSFIIFNRRTLIIQRSNYKSSGKGDWDIPGGTLQFGESLLECLEREIKEEVGLSARVDKLLYAMDKVIKPTKQLVMLVYMSYADSDKVILSHEHIQFLWATKKQLGELISTPTLDDYKKYSVFELLDID